MANFRNVNIRFVVNILSPGRIQEVVDTKEPRRVLIAGLGPPRGYELAAAVCKRLNALGDLGIQALELEGPHALDKLALKYLYEAHAETTTTIVKEK